VPKISTTGYALFYSEKYPKIHETCNNKVILPLSYHLVPNFKVTDIAKRVGSLWKALSPEEKSDYLSKSERLNSATKANYNRFLESLNERQKMALKLLQLSRRSNITRRDLSLEQKEFLNALPKTPFTNGRLLFLSTSLKNKNKDNLGESLADANYKWKNMNDEQKMPYEKQSRLDIERYEEELQKFLSMHK